MGGSSSTANELRFEDKMGAEEVFLHAERQLRTEVEVDELRDVGHDRKSTIHNDETLTVEGQRLSTITKDETLRVTTGNRLMEVQTGTNTENITGFETRTLKSGRKVTIEKGGEEKDITGALKETIKNADVTQTLTTGSYTQTVSTGNATHFAQAGHVFNTPTTILLKADTSVTINSPQLILTGGASVTGSAPKSSWFVLHDAKVYGMVNKATGISTEAKLVSLETKGLAMTGVTFKGEHVGVATRTAALNNASKALEMKNVGVAIGKGGVALYKKVVSIWS
ncbi:bacteriophage T4 gp5 trimerisation domain-containing protein [Eleftheria terrae]|uniref:bacteriophage T4 gp5 trimerisation domain-containing protein n=1 Tax=Eleftheria terrae TaxID=1597781 RepID=UPI003F4DD517